MKTNNLKFFCGNSSLQLGSKVCEYLDIPIGRIDVGKFNDGETYVNIKENVRGVDIFIIQSLCNPVNDSLVELLIMIDAMRRASAKSINIVLPYYGYARQDRKSKGREPITAKLVADLFTASGADRVISIDLHAGQIQGFFNIPVDHLTAIPIIAEHFIKKNLQDIVVVSPDIGGVVRARNLANILSAPIAIIDKKRNKPNESEVMNIIGDVAGKSAIMVDDIIDTGGTICKGANALLQMGASKIYVCCTHGIFSNGVLDENIEEIVITDTIPFAKFDDKRIKLLSVADLIGEAIVRINHNKSVSSMFLT